MPEKPRHDMLDWSDGLQAASNFDDPAQLERSIAADAQLLGVEMRRPNRGIAGFLAYMPRPNRPNEKRWIAAPGILEGAAGIALALLAATTPVEPEWDRMLLLSGSSR